MFAYDKKDSYTFSFTSPDELRLYLERNGYHIPFSKDISPLAAKPTVKTVTGTVKTLKNSLATHPMEGCDAELDGSPSELTRRRYARFSGSGAALVWVEAISVVPEARTSDHQMMITEKNADSFRSLVEETMFLRLLSSPTRADLPETAIRPTRFSQPRAHPLKLFALRTAMFLFSRTIILTHFPKNLPKRQRSRKTQALMPSTSRLATNICSTSFFLHIPEKANTAVPSKTEADL